MDLVSRRDQNVLEQLLPFIDREITVDPEQQDPARRAARRQDVAHAKILLSEERRAEEAKKDNELRAKLDSESDVFSSWSTTDLKGARIGNSLRPNFNVEAPAVETVQPRIRSIVTLGSIPPAVLTTKHRADARKKPLTKILSKLAVFMSPNFWLTPLARPHRDRSSKRSRPTFPSLLLVCRCWHCIYQSKDAICS